MPIFSIIIPIYNKSIYIKKNIHQLLNQTFSNFELILINDGSNDESELLCNNFCQKDERIIVLHQDNLGTGLARNSGINLAKGEYICFVDIDDHVGVNWLQDIYKIISNNNPEVLIYSYKEINPQLNIETIFQFQNKFYNSNESIKVDYISELSGTKFNNGYVWNKVYKRNFLINNNIMFPDLKIQQDEVFNHLVYKNAETLITSSEVLYEYYVYDKGNTRNTFIPNRLKIFRNVKTSFLDLASFWNLKDTQLYDYIHLRFYRNVIFNRNNFSHKDLKKFINEIFNDEDFNDTINYISNNCLNSLSPIEKLILSSINKKSVRSFYKADFKYHFTKIYKNCINYLLIIKRLNLI